MTVLLFAQVEKESPQHVLPFSTEYFNDIAACFNQLAILPLGRENRAGESPLATKLSAGLISKAEMKHRGRKFFTVSPYIIDRIFEGVPRALTSMRPKCMNYEDFVWFWLAEQDRMSDTSLNYWFRYAEPPHTAI